MVIFHSYVKLPEGTGKETQLDQFSSAQETLQLETLQLQDQVRDKAQENRLFPLAPAGIVCVLKPHGCHHMSAPYQILRSTTSK
jgi:hypothetical protein